MADNLTRPTFYYLTFVLCVLVFITCLSAFLIVSTALQISAISYSLSLIPLSNETESKINALTVSFEALHVNIESFVKTLTIKFHDLNGKLVDYNKKVSSNLGTKINLMANEKAKLNASFTFVYKRQNELLIVAEKSVKSYDKLQMIGDTTIGPMLNDTREWSAMIQTWSNLLWLTIQRTLLPYKVTFLVENPHVNLNHLNLKYKSASQVSGGHYLSRVGSSAPIYFPGTTNSDFSKFKIASYDTEDGMFYRNGSTIVGIIPVNAHIHTQVTLPPSAQFAHIFDYFPIYAIEID